MKDDKRIMEHAENVFTVGWCPVCNQGWQVIMKDEGTERLFVLCEECLSVWDNPLEIKMPHKASSATNFMETLPSYKEVEREGWVQYLLAN